MVCTQFSGMYTHAFFMQHIPLHTPSPCFCYHFYLFWPLPPTNGALVARPQYGMGRVELSPLRQGLGSMGVVAGQDPTPRASAVIYCTQLNETYGGV